MHPTRREVIRGMAGTAAAGTLAPLGAGCTGRSSRPGAATREPRFATTMWEFSWLVRRSGDEAEYADWDRVLDELGERGYNSIRIDAFPHLTADGPSGEQVERFTVLPQRPRFYWGNHTPVDVEPRSGLVEFLGKCRVRGIRVGLSTWLNDDALGRRATVATPADFARVWLETLDFLASEDLHDVIEWVDLCNEFPLGAWASAAYRRIFGVDWPNLLPMVLPWTDEVRARVQAYFDEGIAPLRAAYPALRYTFSLQEFAAQTRGLDTSAFDVAEPHVWLSDDPDFILRSGQLATLLEVPGALEAHARDGAALYFGDRDRWVARLAELARVWADWGRERNLPLITTESWGPINYDDLPPLDDAEEWRWVKDVAAEGVRIAVDEGWAGICTSNFCQPHFEGMWADIAWHREQTARIRGISSGAV